MTENPKRPIRVRFAPSPTGPLHFGGVRTALFNWLFARKNEGKFILRIEDTDIERSNPEYEKNIFEGLRWLGLDWDEGHINADSRGLNTDLRGKYIGDYGPYRQSERANIYEKYAQKLLDEKKAYYCFCPKEQLEMDRQAMLAQGLAPKYSGRCRGLTEKETEKRIERGDASVIRFKTPATEIEFNDLIKGKITFNAELLGDIVIAKSLTSPIFIFAGVVDDFEMKISHVIRGEDHLSNTPKQILIQKALGFDEIKYAHLPLVLGPDRSKLSKRYLESSLEDFKKEGYLPEAIINFAALLGWHPKEEKEVLSREELIQKFDLKRVQKSGAVFNPEKLEWLNSQHLKSISAVQLAEKLEGFIPAGWLENKDLLVKAVELEKERTKKLSDFKELGDFFFKLPDYDPSLLVWQKTEKERTAANLKILNEEINKIFKADFNRENLEKTLMPLTEVWGRGELFWPLRVALSGKTASPGPFEIMEALGKEETLKRLNIAIQKLSV